MSDKPPIPDDLLPLWKKANALPGLPFVLEIDSKELNALIERVGRTEAAYWKLQKSAMEQIASLQAEVERLREALDEIAGGEAPPEVMVHVNTDSPAEFRYRMWLWSQERARRALHPEEPTR